MTKKFFILFIFTILLVPAFAQKFTDSKLAYEYYRSKDYEKAIVIYKNLYDNSNNPTNYFSFYMNCLIQLKEYDNAVKLIKKEKKRRPNELSLLVDLGNIFKLQGETEKSTNQYESAIKKLTPDRNQITRLANSFRGKREFRLAEETILKGRDLMNDSRLFRNELASVYLMERKYDLMVDEYMSLLADDKANLKNVKNRFQSAMYIDINDEVYEIIKNTVMSHVQKNPNVTVYSEILIWLYIQKKEFDKAFYQAKALDLRQGEEGQRLMNLVHLTFSNDFLDTTLEILDYLISKGPDSRYYFTAKRSRLEVEYKLLKKKTDYTNEDLLTIESNYKSVLNEFGENANSSEVLLNLSHIQAFYLNKTEAAIKGLESILSMPNVKKDIIDLTKLELADVYLYVDNIWEAALLYAQVEKDNETNPVGHEAKLRKAKLAYYSGDFLWAQAQLDVLKASTSKLISNDAFELALLINDNTALDTSSTAMQMYARAEFLLYQDKTNEAIGILDSLLVSFNGHSLTDDVFYKKGEIYTKLKDYSTAAEYYQKVCDTYGSGILADNSLFALGELNEYYLKDNTKAMMYYERLMIDYPGSIFTVEARKRFRNIRGDSPQEKKEPSNEENFFYGQ